MPTTPATIGNIVGPKGAGAAVQTTTKLSKVVKWLKVEQ